MGSEHAKLTVGIIGAGGNTRLRHLPNLQVLPGVEVRIVCNRTIASARAAADQFAIPHVTDNWRDVLADPSVDAVVIGTWPNMHATLAIEALRANKHVLCEARMAMDAREARAMLQASREHPHLAAQIVPSPFTLPYDATVQEILRQGTLGALAYIQVRGVGSGQFADRLGSPMTWRQNVEYSGLNVLTMGIFYEALERWVGGARRVMAMSQTVVKQRTDPESGLLRAVQVPDHVDVLAEMSCGAQAHMVFSAVTGAARPPHSEIWLHGTLGTLHLDLDDGVLEMGLRDAGGKMEPVEIPAAARGHWRVEEEFVNACRKAERVKLTDFPTAVRYMEFTQAVAQSCATGQAVALPLLAC